MHPTHIRKLDTNRIPTRLETVAISELLSKQDSRVVLLHDEFATRQAILNDLLDRRKQLQNQIEAHKTLISSPIRRLPPDVLSEIFHHCLPFGRNPAMTCREAPVLLGRVCSQWREIAYRTPRLWSAIHIVVPTTDNIDNTCSDQTRLDAIRSWLSRSGVCTLSISLTCSYFELNGPSLETMNRYIDLLSDYTRRWRSIRFSLTAVEWLEFFARYDIIDLPSLEHIRLEGISPYWWNNDDVISPIFLAAEKSNLIQAPRLKSISLPDLGPSIIRLPINWSQLTFADLTHGAWTFQTTIHALRSCHNLEACRIVFLSLDQPVITDGFPTEDIPRPLSLIYLHKLVSLSVIDDEPYSSTSLFATIVAPNIRYLCYQRVASRSYQRSTALEKSLQCFINKTLHPIEELQLYTGALSRNGILPLLSLFPGVKRLSLHNPIFSDFDDHQFRQFIPKAPPGGIVSRSAEYISDWSDTAPFPCLCPKLEVFHCYHGLLSNTLVTDFLRSRSPLGMHRGVSHLQRVEILITSPSKTQLSNKKLQKLKRELELIDLKVAYM